MKPVIKYQGGKTKELPLITSMLPKQFTRVVEPFCGGAAVSFGLNRPSLVNDVNKDVINLYNVIANPHTFYTLEKNVNVYKTLEHDALEQIFYAARDIINKPIDECDKVIRASAYIAVRQLCFSGMERYNNKGEFNVPFGHYKKLSCNMSASHHIFLKEMCTITCGSFENVFAHVNEDDFVFVDPPYLERLGYTDGDGGLKLHEELSRCLKATQSKWMIIHSDHEFYRDTYSEYNIVEKDFAYAQRFGKNKNHSRAKVKHLYITNYNLECDSSSSGTTPIAMLLV